MRAIRGLSAVARAAALDFVYPMLSIRSALGLLLTATGTALAAPDALVDASGAGQFKTVQEAISAAPQNTSAAHPWIIRVAPGTYKETVYVQHEKRFIHL